MRIVGGVECDTRAASWPLTRVSDDDMIGSTSGTHLSTCRRLMMRDGAGDLHLHSSSPVMMFSPTSESRPGLAVVPTCRLAASYLIVPSGRTRLPFARISRPTPEPCSIHLTSYTLWSLNLFISAFYVSAVAKGSPSISYGSQKNDTEARIQGRFISEYDRCRVPITSISVDSHDRKPVAH